MNYFEPSRTRGKLKIHAFWAITWLSLFPESQAAALCSQNSLQSDLQVDMLAHAYRQHGLDSQAEALSAGVKKPSRGNVAHMESEFLTNDRNVTVCNSSLSWSGWLRTALFRGLGAKRSGW